MKFQGFSEWGAARRGPTCDAEQQQRVIIEEDTKYQNARGGTITSELTDEAQAAVAHIIKRRDARLADVDRPRHAAADKKHREDLEDLREAALSFGAKYAALRHFEDERSSFCARESIRQPSRVTDSDLGLRFDALVRRVDAVLRPVTPRATVPRPPLARPDFGGILARLLGQA